MTDVLDSESAYMEGKATWEEFLTKFSTQFFAPQLKSTMRMILASLSPEERSLLEPQAISRLEKFLGGRNATQISRTNTRTGANFSAPPFNPSYSPTGPTGPEANYPGV